MQGPQPGSSKDPVRTPELALWGPPEACWIICWTNIWDWCSSVCVRVCKAPEQMVGDVRLRQTIDFRKQISSLVKQKAPLGPREGKGEGEKGGMGGGRDRRRLSNLCHRQNRNQERLRACERGEKTAPFELHYWGGKEREEERGEESGGKRGEDNGVNASRQAAAELGLITHTLCLSGERRGAKPVFDLQLIHEMCTRVCAECVFLSKCNKIRIDLTHL